jgi:protein-disulfide isomerase
MSLNAMPDDRQLALAPLDEKVDHVRGSRDVDSGLASGQVLGTPTLFIDGVVHRGGYDPPTLLAALGP